MNFSLLADIMLESIYDISTDMLGQKGVKLLLLDFDNTILPYKTTQVPPTFAHWLEIMRSGDIKLAVVSNSGRPRVAEFCNATGLTYVQSAGKPGTSGLKRAAAYFDIPIENAALAGDQTFTDVLAANRCGAVSILVKPIDMKNPFLWFRHQLEKPFIWMGKRKIQKSGGRI